MIENLFIFKKIKIVSTNKAEYCYSDQINKK